MKHGKKRKQAWDDYDCPIFADLDTYDAYICSFIYLTKQTTHHE